MLPNEHDHMAGPDSRAVVAPVFACLAMLVSYLPFSEFTSSVGVLATATGAGPGATTWIADAYVLALAAVVLPAGGLAVRFGARRVTDLGLGATVCGAGVVVVAGVVPAAGLELLLAGAAICGLGGGLVMSASLALVNGFASSDGERNRGIGLWAAALVVGLAAGPFIAAAVLAVGRWFATPTPAAVLAVGVLVLGRRVPETPVADTAMDVPGSVLVAGSVLALVAGVAGLGGSGGSTTSAVALLAGGLAVAVALVVVEHRRGSGLLRLEMFSSPGFVAAAVAAAAALFTMAGLVVVVGISLTADGVGPLGVAVRLLALFGANVAASVGASRLSRRLGQRGVVVGGLALAAAGAAAVALLGVHDVVGLTAGLAVTGLGCGLVMATTSAVAITAVVGRDPHTAPELAAVAGATNNALRQLGASLGPAVLGALVVHPHDPVVLDRATGQAALAAGVVLAAAAVLTAALLGREH